MRYCIILVLVLSKVDVMLCCLVVWLPQAEVLPGTGFLADLLMCSDKSLGSVPG